MRISDNLGLLGGMWLTAVAQGGQISELFLADPAIGMPNAVEVFGLNGLGQADLVIIDAGIGSRHGEVLQVVTLDAPLQVVLVSDAPWPGGLWAEVTGPAESRMVGDDLAGNAFAFTRARTILLFDRKTNLDAHRSNLFTDPLQQSRVAGATLLDWVTFAPGGEATTLDNADLGSIVLNEPFTDEGEAQYVIDTAQGDAMARPRVDGGFSRIWLVGNPNALGQLTTLDQPFDLTPGLTNPALQGPRLPEPTSAACLLAGLGLLLKRARRPRQDCPAGSSRLSYE